MPETTRKRLKDHRIVGGVVSNWFYVVVGIIVTGGESVALIWLAVALSFELDIPFHLGFLIFVGALAVAVVVSYWLFRQGVTTESRRARIRRLRMEASPEPWRYDHRWNPHRARAHALRPLLTVWAFVIGWWALAALGTYAAIESGGEKRADLIETYACLVIAYVLALLFTFVGMYELARWMKYGDSYLRFERFPFFLGEKLRAYFSTNRGIAPFDKITFTLRCVAEAFETRGRRFNRRRMLVSYQVYADTLEIEGPQQTFGALEMPISFLLPKGEYQTHLSGHPPRYWELEVHAAVPGVDLKATFFVPVYAPPR